MAWPKVITLRSTYCFTQITERSLLMKQNFGLYLLVSKFLQIDVILQ
jgi:hypothetical protein